MKTSLVVALVAAALLCACTDNKSTPTASLSQLSVFTNQLHYRAAGSKGILVQIAQPQHWMLVDNAGKLAAEGTATPAHWPEAGRSVAWVDFSSVTAPGNYSFSVAGEQLASVTVAKNPWQSVHDTAIKSFYLNRAGQHLDADFAGDYARAAGHPDTQVLVHASAATASRPEGTVISAPGGWYDAGDYNKYVVNSGISTYTLLLAYHQHKFFYRQRQWAIPESGGPLPDLLAEVKYNLDWLLAMQDEDGGVYHKLTSLRFNPMEMPAEDDDTRYVVHKNTAATLNFVAVMASASRAFAEYDPALSEHYLQVAVAAWHWAKKHPDLPYQQPDDVVTGEYGDKQLGDEWFWAGAELYVATGDDNYMQPLPSGAVVVPAWSDVATLGLISLATQTQHEVWRKELLGLADQLLLRTQVQPGFTLSAQAGDFVWGSNAVAMNQAMVLFIAQALTGKKEYAVAAEKLLHYVMGANPTGYSFISGLGRKQAKHLHHRVSEADGIARPIPGMLIGGPNPDQQDNCQGYPSKLPALSYLDDVCSYSTNETAINWTAPLVFVLAAFSQSEQ